MCSPSWHKWKHLQSTSESEEYHIRPTRGQRAFEVDECATHWGRPDLPAPLAVFKRDETSAHSQHQPLLPLTMLPLLLPEQKQLLLQIKSIAFNLPILTFQADHSQQINSLFQPISPKAIFVIGKIFSRFTFLTLYADCSCVPARSFVSRFLLSFTPDTFLPISMQPREYTEYKYTTLTLYNLVHWL